MALSLSLSTSHSVLWYTKYPYTHHSLPGGTQTIPLLITVSLVVLRLSLYSSQSTWWLRQSLCSAQSPWWYSDYPITHLRLSGDTQTIPLLITVSMVALRLSLYSSQSTWWLRQSLYSSQFPWWYSDYPYTHHSLSSGTQTIPILTTVSLLVGHQSIPINITFCLVVLRLTLYTSQSLWL